MLSSEPQGFTRSNTEEVIEGEVQRGNKASISDILVASPKHLKEPRVKEKKWKTLPQVQCKGRLQHFNGLKNGHLMPKKENSLGRHKF